MSNDVLKLEDADIQNHLQSFPSWTVSNGGLRREFLLPSFPSSIFFVNAVAHFAELAAHHPDIHILYNRVILHISTHSVGGISEKDFALAGHIDELWHSFDVHQKA